MAGKVDTGESTKINLMNDVTVNGHTFKAGSNVEVPQRQAEDLMRIDHEHQQYKENLHKKRTFEVDGGTIGVGGN